MIKTIVMNWDRQRVIIDAGIEKEKLSNRITEKNRVTDGFGAMFEWISILASVDNMWPVLISDYTEDKQENTQTESDFIEIKPWGTIVLPRNKEVQALNQPFLMGESGDTVSIIAR